MKDFILEALNPFTSYKIARIGSIDISIQSNLLIIYSLMLLISPDLDSLIFIGVYSLLLFFVLLHEFGHAITAIKLGFDCPNISIGMLGGMASIKNLDKATPKQELLIVAMGPLVNLALFGLLYGLSWSLITDTKDLTSAVGLLLRHLAIFNFFIFLFNVILCVWPMDGGRIVKCLIKICCNNPEKVEILSFRCSLIFAILGLVYFSYNFSLNGILIIGIMLVFAWAEKISQLRLLKNQS